jgi:hypothetical protein
MAAQIPLLSWEKTLWEAEAVKRACVAALGSTATAEDQTAVQNLVHQCSAQFDIRGLQIRLLDISLMERLHTDLVRQRPSIAAAFANKTLIRLQNVGPFPLFRRTVRTPPFAFFAILN